MFGPRYFGHRHFGPRYFGDGSDTPAASASHGVTTLEAILNLTSVYGRVLAVALLVFL